MCSPQKGNYGRNILKKKTKNNKTSRAITQGKMTGSRSGRMKEKAISTLKGGGKPQEMSQSK